jgi:hypothetical protein
MDETALRQFVIEELGPISERLGWTPTHREVELVLEHARDETGADLSTLDERLVRALVRFVAWRRAWRALILERGITLPLGGGSIGNDVLVERALDQARAAYAEYRGLVREQIEIWEVT